MKNNEKEEHEMRTVADMRLQQITVVDMRLQQITVADMRLQQK